MTMFSYLKAIQFEWYCKVEEGNKYEKQLSVFLASTMIIGNVGVSTSMSYADTNDVSRISGNDRFFIAGKKR